MINNGVPDEDVLTAWLTDLHFEEYFNLFLAAGYDMPTISRMTPEDLTAIGIQNPAHRKKLKSEISKLNITDGLPDYIPGSLEEWLRLLRLEEYHQGLVAQGYSTIHQVATINIEDLEDTGFYRLGHQKRLVLAIRRLKELSHGSTPAVQPPFQPYSNKFKNKETPVPNVRYMGGKTGAFSSFQQPESHSVTSSPFPRRKTSCPPEYQHQGASFSPVPGPVPGPGSCVGMLSIHRPQLRGLHQGGEQLESPAQMPEPMPPIQYPSIFTHQLQYPGSPRCNPRGIQMQQPPPQGQQQTQQQQQLQNYRLMQRSYDDADILRHADHSVLIHNSCDQQSNTAARGGTLPRLKGLSVTQRPVARVTANTRIESNEVPDLDHIDICDNQSESMPGLKSNKPLGSQSEGVLLCKSGTSSPNMTLQRRSARSGSDAGLQLKRNSSFDSDSGSGLPFANDNAGTIRMRSHSNILLPDRQQQQQDTLTAAQKRNAGDVLQDIGSMLSDLTDELDAMLKLDREEQ